MSEGESLIERYAKRIADQVSAENGLIAQRSGWNLTIQGFLFATVGIVAQKESKLDPGDLRGVAFVAILISALTVLSVAAAYLQKQHLMERWTSLKSENEDLETKIHPRPFGDDAVHKLGMVAAAGIPFVIIGFWTVFLACVQ